MLLLEAILTALIVQLLSSSDFRDSSTCASHSCDLRGSATIAL